MGVRRWLLLLFAPLGLLVLPACVTTATGPLLPFREQADIPEGPPPPVRSPSGKAKAGVKFADLPRTPGERVSLNPPPMENPPPVSMEPDPPATVVHIPTDPLPPLDITPPALVRAFQAFHDHQPDKAIEHLKEFDGPNQELLLQLIPAVVQASKANLGKQDGEEAITLARQFEAAAAAILKRGGFGIRKAFICTAVKGFGVYDPLLDPSAPLLPGNLYSLYVELENVPSLPDVVKGVNGYLTRLECEMRVMDEFGQTVEIQDLKTKTPGPKSTRSKSEFTRSPVRDYHLTAVMQAPSRPGAYTVTYEVRDPRTGRTVSKPIAFRVQ
jgi:hypothetical protein